MSADKDLNPVAVALVAGDLLAQKAKAMCDALAAAQWTPLSELRDATQTYLLVRRSEPVSDEPAPQTERSTP